jgi:UDP-N-acetylglucosamine 2-epimerase (non-hydrolysing)
LSESRPDAVLVYGDTNSTLAGALAAVKLHIPVAHVEAGLRSFNRRMPEELNRITADHLSDLLFAPTKTAVDNLAAEGLHSRAILTGDVMYDAVLLHAKAAGARSSVLRDLGTAAGEYGVLTIHRAENTTAADLRTLLGAVNRAAARFGRIIFPVHPRTAVMLRGPLSDWRPEANLTLAEPLGYFDMLALVQGANWVLTDSGGLQKEAFFLNRPCITLRDETEWLETLEAGANRIAGHDGARLEEHLVELAHRPRSTGAAGLDRTAAIVGIAPAGEGPFGDGRAAERVVEGICALCESSQ